MPDSPHLLGMLRYWILVVARAEHATRKWLIGDLWRSLIQLALFIVATIVLASTGQFAQAKEQLTWAVAVLEAALLIFAPIFCFQLLRAPSEIDREKDEEITRLRAISGLSNTQTFAIAIEEIPPSDGDRNNLGGENLVRAKITNLDAEKTFQAYACLEDVTPPTGASPAAKLQPMGKPRDDGNLFSITPSESVYVLVLERDSRRGNIFIDDHEDQFVRFSLFNSSSDPMTAGAALAIAEDKAALHKSWVYDATLAVHAEGAKSARLHFSVCVLEDGRISLNTSG